MLPTERDGQGERGGQDGRGSLTALSALIALIALTGCGGESKNPTGPVTGAISVAIAGLPAQTAARVTLSGPSGYSHALSASANLPGLPPGTYQVTAQHVNAPGLIYSASVSSANVSLSAGESAAVTVTYSGAAAPLLDLVINGTQLLQSAQRSDGSVPMVAGRDALLRVFVTANQANSAQPQVLVRLYHQGAQVDSLTVSGTAAGVPQTADTATLASSWNVVIPANRVSPDLGIVALLDPTDQIPEADESDNRWPAMGTHAVDVLSVPALNLRFVPVHLTANGMTGNATNANKAVLADLTRRMWPLGVVDVDVRSTFTTSAPALQSDDGNGGWGQVLSEIYALENADGSNRHYVGIVPTSYTSGIAGLGYIGAPASVAWDKAGSAPEVVAHELGHNFGRQHAPCGNPSGPDPGFPYVGGSIGVWGLDQGDLSLKSPVTYKDVMSYCNPDWVSDYNYEAVLNYRGSGPMVATAPAGIRRPGLLVWGRILGDSLILEPSFVVDAPARLPSAPGRYRVRGQDQSSGTAFDLSFVGEPVPDLPGGLERHFAFVVPLPATELSSISLSDGRSVKRIQAATSRPKSVAAPSSRHLSSGEVEVRWNPAYPMALVRDADTREVLAFSRGPIARIATGGRRITLDLSDGVMTRSHAVVAP